MSTAIAPALDEKGIIVSCDQCGQSNRIPFQHLGSQGRCGGCKSTLPGVNRPIEVTSIPGFQALTARASIPVLVDFWAPWCGPCQMVAPEVERTAAGAERRFVVAKVNTEALPQLGGMLGIRSIPTFVVFTGGKEATRSSGALPAAQLQALVLKATGGASR